jgi:hypothetical protein
MGEHEGEGNIRRDWESLLGGSAGVALPGVGGKGSGAPFDPLLIAWAWWIYHNSEQHASDRWCSASRRVYTRHHSLKQLQTRLHDLVCSLASVSLLERSKTSTFWSVWWRRGTSDSRLKPRTKKGGPSELVKMSTVYDVNRLVEKEGPSGVSRRVAGLQLFEKGRTGSFPTSAPSPFLVVRAQCNHGWQCQYWLRLW